MASLYTRPNSPFWWIKYRPAGTRKVKRESTGFLHGTLNGNREAEQLKARRTIEEGQGTPEGSELFSIWVIPYLEMRYADSPATCKRMLSVWYNWSVFFEEKKITIPQQVKREHCIEYMTWRRTNPKQRKPHASHNTALYEMKCLSVVLGEAVVRKLIQFNPCRDLKIKRLPAREKPDFPPDVVKLIRTRLKEEAEPRRTFLDRSFEIAHYHGVRISETYLNPMTQVEFLRKGRNIIGMITFTAKGRKPHTVRLHPKLHPLFKRLRAEGKTETYEKPKSASNTWYHFLERIGLRKALPGACFHSNRVTAASKLARAGVSEKKAMAYLGHASTTVHRTYVRLRLEDLSDCEAAMD